MKVLTTDQLKQKIDAKGNYILLDVLAPESYEVRHIPTARNVRKGPDFVERFDKEIGASKDMDIILYCSSATCTASPQMGEMLERAGYTNVSHYLDGLAGWQGAGLALEP